MLIASASVLVVASSILPSTALASDTPELAASAAFLTYSSYTVNASSTFSRNLSSSSTLFGSVKERQ